MYKRTQNNILKKIQQLQKSIELHNINMAKTIEEGDLRENASFEIIKNSIKCDLEEVKKLREILETYPIKNFIFDVNKITEGVQIEASGIIIKEYKNEDLDQKASNIESFFKLKHNNKIPKDTESLEKMKENLLNRKFIILFYPNNLFLLDDEKDKEVRNGLIILKDEEFCNNSLLNRCIQDTFIKIEKCNYSNRSYKVEYTINSIKPIDINLNE